MTTTNITEAERSITKSLNKSNHSSKCDKALFKRAKFNCHNQKDKSTKQYITALLYLRETCQFGAIADKLILTES